jgi:hypothetical protein
MHLRKPILKVIAFCWLGAVIATGPSCGANGDHAIKSMQAQANIMKERLIDERGREIEARTNTIQDKIQAINESAEIEIAKVPQFFYNGWGYPVPNPDYERTVAYIRVDAQKEINAINKDFREETKKIEAVYREKLNAIDSSVANVGSQIRPGTSDVQLTPVGSNLYVKNYVNYVGDKPKSPATKGLKGKEKSLAYKTVRSTKKRDIQP